MPIDKARPPKIGSAASKHETMKQCTLYKLNFSPIWNSIQYHPLRHISGADAGAVIIILIIVRWKNETKIKINDIVNVTLLLKIIMPSVWIPIIFALVPLCVCACMSECLEIGRFSVCWTVGLPFATLYLFPHLTYNCSEIVLSYIHWHCIRPGAWVEFI